MLENERLLVSLLPASGAAHVREGNAEARRSFADVTVAYINLVGFESLSPELGEDESMALLSDVVAACDEAAEHHGVEKVRTIGSSYLAVSGLSVERPDHTARMVEFAREVVRIVKRFNAERGVRLVAEIGINAGPVVGGLVGRRKFIYDLWGDTVKLARGIESDGRTSILVTRPVYDRVRELVDFGPATRADVRGMGSVELFSVAGRGRRMSDLLNLVQAQWRFALALVVGFPLLLVVLNEWGFALARAGHPVAASVRFVRTWVVPLVAVVLFLRWVALVPPTGLAVRLTESLCLAATIIAIIGVVNNVVFESAQPGELAAQGSQTVARPDPAAARRHRPGDGLLVRLGTGDRERPRGPRRHVDRRRAGAAGTAGQPLFRPHAPDGAAVRGRRDHRSGQRVRER